jgi:hypothetical protein
VKLANVRVTYDLFDGDGEKLGEATAFIKSLDPGQDWKFKAPSKGKAFTKHKLADLRSKK